MSTAETIEEVPSAQAIVIGPSSARDYVEGQIRTRQPIVIGVVMRLTGLGQVGASRFIHDVQDAHKPAPQGRQPGTKGSPRTPRRGPDIVVTKKPSALSIPSTLPRLRREHAEGVASQRGGPLAVSYEQLLEALRQGLSTTEIADRFGLSKSGAQKRLKPLRAQLQEETPSVPDVLQGTDEERSSLSPAQWRERQNAMIVAALKAGHSVASLNSRIGLSRQAIYNRINSLRKQGILPERDPTIRKPRKSYSAGEGGRPHGAKQPAVKSFVFYDGPSMLDGAPILGIVTGLGWSENSKTGDMLHTWIIRRDLAPNEAVASGADASIC